MTQQGPRGRSHNACAWPSTEAPRSSQSGDNPNARQQRPANQKGPVHSAVHTAGATPPREGTRRPAPWLPVLSAARLPCNHTALNRHAKVTSHLHFEKKVTHFPLPTLPWTKAASHGGAAPAPGSIPGRAPRPPVPSHSCPSPAPGPRAHAAGTNEHTLLHAGT